MGHPPLNVGALRRFPSGPPGLSCERNWTVCSALLVQAVLRALWGLCRQSSSGPSLPIFGEKGGLGEGSLDIYSECASLPAYVLALRDCWRKSPRLPQWLGSLPGFGGYLGPQPPFPGFPGPQSHRTRARMGATPPPQPWLGLNLSTGPKSPASSSSHSPICSTSRRDGCRSWTSLER